MDDDNGNGRFRRIPRNHHHPNPGTVGHLNGCWHFRSRRVNDAHYPQQRQIVFHGFLIKRDSLRQCSPRHCQRPQPLPCQILVSILDDWVVGGD